jgi:hypothetical protein
MDGEPGYSTMRLYGAAIAFASGGYAVAVGTTGTTAGATLMWVLGVIVVVHGAVLLTSWRDRLGDASGPLMLAYAVLMLANQAWMATMPSGGMMDGGMNGGMGPSGSMAMGWDPGMVTLALLMLASGAIMTARSDMD